MSTIKDSTRNDNTEIRLCLGGDSPKQGWTIVNAQAGPAVDIVADIRDLSFSEASILEIYASHVMEHLSFAEVLSCLEKFYKILKPGGRLYISVPDIEILSEIILSENSNEEIKCHALRMMFGGQVDEWDYHKSGWTQNILLQALISKGFCEIFRVRNFGIFQDTSSYEPYNIPISINIKCRK